MGWAHPCPGNSGGICWERESPAGRCSLLPMDKGRFILSMAGHCRNSQGNCFSCFGGIVCSSGHISPIWALLCSSTGAVPLPGPGLDLELSSSAETPAKWDRSAGMSRADLIWPVKWDCAHFACEKPRLLPGGCPAWGRDLGDPHRPLSHRVNYLLAQFHSFLFAA